MELTVRKSTIARIQTLTPQNIPLLLFLCVKCRRGEARITSFRRADVSHLVLTFPLLFSTFLQSSASCSRVACLFSLQHVIPTFIVQGLKILYTDIVQITTQHYEDTISYVRYRHPYRSTRSACCV